MPTNKRITDLTDYTSVLPYASEMFGVYQPMIGWKSKRITARLKQGLIDSQNSLLKTFAQNYEGVSEVSFHDSRCFATIENIQIGKLQSNKLSKTNKSVLLQSIIAILPKDKAPVEREWKQFINQDILENLLKTTVAQYYVELYNEQCSKIITENNPLIRDREVRVIRPIGQLIKTKKDLEIDTKRLVNEESAIAGSLLGMFDHKMFAQLEGIFYKKPDGNLELVNAQIAEMLNNDDPFVTFDPKKDIKNVCLSPLGIVHLFRQYFFELDTFLGTPTGHVWLSPGSSVELIEVSTRRTYTERIVEISTESITKTENSTTDQDELSEAVKKDNKTDLKLGASLTVNQSWGTGNATATGSLNMEKTQQTASETTKKRMRQQTAKLSTEIKQNYKSTFKTITEVTDTSSKRYVLNNSTPHLINYELRRKMRQVGVQVQDIGTYLCWETFVDEPGKQLGLANLVHIAKPVDLVLVPDTSEIPVPVNKPMTFTAKVSYNFGDNEQFNGPDGFLPLGTRTFGTELPDIPDGYDILPNTPINIKQLTAAGKDFQYTVYPWRAKIVGKEITFGIILASDGLDWDNEIGFEIGVEIQLTASQAKKDEIAAANKARIAAGNAANEANKRKTKEEYLNAAKERIELASTIKIRKYEDLREEERIIVYRNLIAALMSDALYARNLSGILIMPDGSLRMPESNEDRQARHTLSELINSIFDIDKMLYFVAPEWWKPRLHSTQNLGFNMNNNDIFTGNLTNWSDYQDRQDNYYITDKSEYAKMGSSLGWLLQLDGDDLRNAFLNAPWVKAVIPIRPGKELEAINWLQQMNVEGADGLDALYHAPDEELNKIKTALGINAVTFSDAIKYLCAEVAQKHKESIQPKGYKYENGEEKEMELNDAVINDANIVSATPIDKVYEHGFYPLKGGFRAAREGNFKVFSQWIEVLPTDQVVPVEVKYDPKTGRQIIP